MAKIAVIVCTKDRPGDLERFIKSLLGQRVSARELIIVDASIDSELIKSLSESLLKESPITLKYLHTAASLTRQRNIGISLLDPSSEYVCFFDDDVVLYDDTTENMIRVFRENSNAGAVQGTEVNVPEQHMLVRMFRGFFLMSHISGRWTLLPSGEHTAVVRPRFEIRTRSLLAGYCLKKNVVDEFEFDEHFGGYAFLEDYDFALRISKKYPIVLSPSVRYIHNRSATARLDVRALSKMRIVNKAYVFRKNMERRWTNKLAFWWSIVGHLVLNLAKSLLRSNPDYIIGTWEGVLSMRS